MATYSPTILAFPDGMNIGTSVLGGLRLVGSASPGSGAGLYKSDAPPQILNISNGQVYQPIPVMGFDELYVMPVAQSLAAAAAEADNMYVYAIYGNKQTGAEQTEWMVHLLYTAKPTSPATTAVSLRGSTNTNYITQAIAFTAGFSTVLDSTIGAATLSITGDGVQIGTIGSPHVGGADYIAITYDPIAAPPNNGSVNAYVRFG